MSVSHLKTGDAVVCQSRVYEKSMLPNPASAPAGSRGIVGLIYNHVFDGKNVGKLAFVTFTNDDGYTFTATINVRALARASRRTK